MKHRWQQTGRYRAQVTHPARPGKRLSLRASSPGEMLARLQWVEELRRDVTAGMRSPLEVERQLQRFGRLDTKITTIDALCEVWRAGLRIDARPKALSTWRRQLAPCIGGAQWWELTAERMRAWEAWAIGKGYAPKTIAAAFSQVSAALTLAQDAGHIDGTPWGRWQPRKATARRQREAARTMGELEAIIQAARDLDPRGDLADRIIVMALCGLRQGEATALGWDDIARGELRIRHNAIDGWQDLHPDWDRPKDPPKGRAAATIALHPDAVKALERQWRRQELAGIARADGPVFPVWRGARAGQWRHMYACIDPAVFRRVIETAGVPNPDAWDVHSLRHSFATLEGAHAADPRDTQRRTRHASLAQLAAYAHGSRDLPASKIPRLTITITEKEDE